MNILLDGTRSLHGNTIICPRMESERKMIQFDVLIDEFLLQVQEKINPSLTAREVVIIFRDKIVCGTESIIRKLGTCLPVSISDICPKRPSTNVVYISHSIMSVDQFGL